jgi:tetratricopeptide (TPR) repeat protein/TolB-like protein
LLNTPTDPLIGSSVSHYEIVAKLGGGGMGVVYKATDTKLGRPVALKFLPPQWSHDESAKQRFLREAQAASATNHPNICVIHDIGQTDDGRLFIVMAYYEGQTLKQKLESGPLPVGEAVEIATEVAEGLAKAHAQGVVHRDIKPGNLMVTDDGVKVLDFGLAKFADALQLTIPGSTVGTVHYMSPEQARGEEADARSDVWALGVVLYEMLTGEVPFKGAYPEAVFHAVKNEPLPPLRIPEGEASAPLEALVLRALEKEPEKRYQSARELARDLRLLQGRTVPLDLLTGPVPYPPRLKPLEAVSRWERVRRAVTPMRAAAALVVLLAVGAASYWRSTRPIVRIPVAIAPFANHTGEPELDAYRLALTETLTGELASSPNVRVIQYRRLLEIVRRFIGAGEISSSEAIRAIAARSTARFIVVPSLEYRNDTRTWLLRAELVDAANGATTNKYDTEAVTSTLPKDTVYRLLPSLANGIQQYYKVNGPGRSYNSRPVGARPRSLEAARAFEEGLNLYEQLEYGATLDAFSRAASADNQHAMTQAWLCRVLLILNRSNDAVAAGQRARQLTSGETPATDAAFIQGVAAESQGDFKRAEEQYQRLATLAPDDPSARVELADFLKRRDRNQEAVTLFHEVSGLDTHYVRPHVDLCQLYAGALGNFPLAEQHAQTALEQYRAEANGAGQAQALLCLADTQRKQAGSHLPEARRNAAKARELFESHEQAFGYNLARAVKYQGDVDYADGNFREAVRFFEEAVSRSRTAGNRVIEGLALMNLGSTYNDLGHQPRPAIDYYRQSRDVFERMGDERRAAQADINVAHIQIDYGTDRDDALRRLANAQATLDTLGDIEFKIDAMVLEAADGRNSGRLTEAKRQLIAGLNIATDRNLDNRKALLTVEIAKTDLLLGNYDAIRKSLEGLMSHGGGRIGVEGRIVLGNALTRLGNFDAARTHLDMALADIEAQQLLQYAPLVQAALGELVLESGQPQKVAEARAHFEKGAAFRTEDLPDAASIEATSYLGFLDAQDRRNSAAVMTVEASLQQAIRMGRLALEAICRLHLARIKFSRGQRGQYKDALDALAHIPIEGEPTIGPELQAQVHYWRGLAMANTGNRAGADAEAATAKALVHEIQESIPAPLRGDFASRREIKRILDQDPVRKHD